MDYSCLSGHLCMGSHLTTALVHESVEQRQMAGAGWTDTQEQDHEDI